MKCGVCGGGVRGFSGTLHGRPIRDWKHTDVPPGTAPHRPVLGTPVDQATLDRIHRAEVEQAPLQQKLDTAPVVSPRPATAGELTSCSSAELIVKLASAEGWDVKGTAYLQTHDSTEYLVVKVRRRDLGAIAIWRRRPNKVWEFDEGWQLTCRGINQVQSKSLKTWLRTRDEACADCGASSVVHGKECHGDGSGRTQGQEARAAAAVG